MMVKLLQYSKRITEAYEKNNMKQVYEEILKFVVDDISSFYLEFMKDRVVT